MQVPRFLACRLEQQQLQYHQLCMHVKAHLYISTCTLAHVEYPVSSTPSIGPSTSSIDASTLSHRHRRIARPSGPPHKSHVSLKHIVSSDEVALYWSRVWDSALDHGHWGTRLPRSLFKPFCYPLFGERKC